MALSGGIASMSGIALLLSVQVRLLRNELPAYQLRQRVRPGITGRAQVSLAYDSCIEDVRLKVEADLEYIKSQSLIEDLKIMVKTPAVMLFRKGSR